VNPTFLIRDQLFW